ncbi:phage terminase large subunit [Sphingobium sp. WTD-1]|uniref:phage terminase large subunit n=1 Tax=Sphingobium sp. WTD-1 TaxID=2979467 RepID=UPI0024DE3F88|nr:phage terminase large subunit [Sphingobium sp. WTD-1]WIA54326.1 phage terminase large subunit [Sphingobium sp. WTD-1]
MSPETGFADEITAERPVGIGHNGGPPIAKLTPRQEEARDLLASPARNIMLRGGSRSGKTFLLCRAIVQRAINAPGSRHAIFRFRFNHAKTSIWADTLPKVLKLCFPALRVRFDKTDFYVELPNGSQIWIAGLDDKERVEKILGAEYCTLYFNESSQIPWGSVEIAMSRLAQKCELAPKIAAATGRTHLPLKAYYDCVAGETVLDGHTKTIAELAETGEPITVMTTHGPRLSSAPWLNGYGEVFTVTTSAGRTIRATASHRFWTRDGWKRLDAIAIGHELLCSAQSQFPHDGQGDPAQTQTPPDWPENCCRCLHQCDGQLRPAVDGDQVCPASASDAGQHSRCACLHDGSGSRMGRLDQPEARHSLHSQSSREPLSQASGDQRGRIPAHAAQQICGSSQRKSRSDATPLTAVRLAQSGGEPPAIARPRLTLAWYWRTARDAAAIGRQWLRCNLLARLSLDPNGPGREGRKSLSLASDTPVVAGHEYETVVDISQPTTVAFYTVDVPFSRHYLANGFVSHNCNPPSKLHWSFQMFRAKVKPGTKEPLPNPDDYAEMKVNPSDNADNLPAEYFEVLASMSAAKRLRFEAGEWASEVNGALWALEDRQTEGGTIPGIDVHRATLERSPDDGRPQVRYAGAVIDLQRIVVAVDPSGTKGDGGGDDIGIVVAAKGIDGRGYVLQDATCQLSPDGWGRRSVEMYRRWGADRVVGERNFGGAMVEFVVKTADNSVPYKEANATRGKVVRAEPISALYEQGKVSHVGDFPDLEDQMCNFTASGFVGEGSPDRADAMVWALTELMLNGKGSAFDVL